MAAKKAAPTKPWWQSRTVIGVVIMVLTPILANYGISEQELSDLAGVFGEAVGAALALYGRAKAQGGISL